jgi:tetratricopeptide (TPR) repeat protein
MGTNDCLVYLLRQVTDVMKHLLCKLLAKELSANKLPSSAFSSVRSLFVVILLHVSACSTIVEEPDPLLLAEIRGGDDAAVAQVVDILELSDEVKSFIDGRIEPRMRTSKKLEILHEILFSPELFSIEYESGATKTATETYLSHSGNCLSMTNLFIAMARYVDLDAHYHLAEMRPQWDLSGNILIWTQHINSTGMLRNGSRYVLDFLAGQEFYAPDMKTVSDNYALAIYYNNLAAESILVQKYEVALRYLRTGLMLEPEMSDIWNNMGATMRRMNRRELAKASYLQAIHFDSYNHTAMSNLSRLYLQEGNTEMGSLLADKVKYHRIKNPYFRYANARQLISKQEYKGARRELNAAIRLKEDEAIFFVALADVYAGLGNEEKKNTSLQLARMLRESSGKTRSSLEIYQSGNVILR